MNHNTNDSDHKERSERPESKTDRVEKRAENRERGEACIELANGALNKDIQAAIVEKRLSRKSGATGYGVASADSLLPLDKKSKGKVSVPEGISETEYIAAVKQAEAQQQEKTPIALIAQGVENDPFNQQSKIVSDGSSSVSRSKSVDAGLEDARQQLLKDGAPSSLVDSLKPEPKKLEGYINNTPDVKEKIEESPVSMMAKAMEPVTDSFSKFTAESTKHLHNMMEEAKEAFGIKPSEKPHNSISPEGFAVLQSVESPRDASHVLAGAVTGFDKTINEAMPGLTPRGALEATAELGKRIVDRALHPAPEAVLDQLKHQLDPIGAFKDDIAKLGKKYDQMVDWAADRSQKSFSERGESAGKAGPDVLMAAEGIVFIAKSGEWITRENAIRAGLEKLTPEELKERGITKTTVEHMKPEDIVNPIDRNASPEEKIRQLQKLSAENQPLIEDFKNQVDSKYGSFSYGEPKKPQDILDKPQRQEVREKYPWFEIEHVRDSQRFTTVVDNLDALPAIAKDLKESGFQVIDAPISKMEPNKRGWRMMPFDLRAPNGQLIEYQVLFKEMAEAGRVTHPIHKKWRGSESSELSKSDKILKQTDFVTARDTCNAAWDAYLKRTGQNAEHIRTILEQVQNILRQ